MVECVGGGVGVGVGSRHSSGDSLTHLNNSNLLRSRSSQSLRQTPDVTSLTGDDRLTVLVQMFWISVSLLESDFEHEFLLAVRLLDKVNSVGLHQPWLNCRLLTSSCFLTLWRPLLSYEYSYKASCARQG